MTKPTFFDRVRYDALHDVPIEVLGGIAGPVHPGDKLGNMMRPAVPFVVDDHALVTAMEMRTGLLVSRRIELPDVARVPFEHTWVEYDPKVKVPEPNEDTSLRVGHLIIRTVEGASVMTFHLDQDGKSYCMLPLTMNWTTDPHYDAPWRHQIGDNFTRRFTDATADWVRSKLLTGRPWLPTWKNRIGGDLFQRQMDGLTNEEAMNDAVLISGMHKVMFDECSAMLSLLMGILALVAWCPTELLKTKPHGRWVHKGKTRPYMETTHVKIRIPIRTAYLHVERAGREIKRRRHRVREHLRVYHRGRPNQKIVVVAEHMRGDASEGFVHQDYEVTS